MEFNRIAAALAEDVYRRSPADLPLEFQFGQEALTRKAPIEIGYLSAYRSQDENIDYYYSPEGLCASVTKVGGCIYLTFRGTDTTGAVAGIESTSYFSYGANQYVEDPTHNTDYGDAATNILAGLGAGTSGQIDEALLLAKTFHQLAVQQGLELVIAGQSLGGGLASVAASVEGVTGYVFAPAPFGNELHTIACQQAAVQCGLDSQLSSLDYKVGLPGRQIQLTAYAASLDDQYQLILGSNSPISKEKFLQYASISESLENKFTNSKLSNIHISAVESEAMTQGMGMILPFSGLSMAIGSSDMDVVEIGLTTSEKLDLTIQANLHGQSLAGLIFTTHYANGAYDFAELLKADRSLRYGLIQNADISGLPLHGRADPDDAPGGSKIADAYVSTNPLYRVLWSSYLAGTPAYSDFYRSFQYVNGNGMTSEGLNKSVLDNTSLHSAIVDLGLDWVKYHMIDPTVEMLPFGNLDSDRIVVNVTPVPTAGSGSFGVSALDHYLDTRVLEALGLDLPVPGIGDAVSLSKLMTGIPGFDTSITDNVLGSVHPSFSYGRVVVQSGSDGGGLTYSVPDDVNTVVIGGKGVNTLSGGAGRDILVGGIADDTLTGGAGADILVSGGGHDTASYASSTGGIFIDMSDHQRDMPGLTVGHGGDAEGDVLVGIQDVVGSSTTGNYFRGDDRDNTFTGGAASDTFALSGGHDKFIGGKVDDPTDAHDTLDLSKAGPTGASTDAGYKVDLQSGTVTAKDGGPTLADLVSIEDVEGSAQDDVIIGGPHGGHLFGGDGWDAFVVGSGHTEIDGGTGFNKVYLGALWGAYHVDVGLDGYDCTLTDAAGNVCQVNNVGTFVFGTTTIGNNGEQLTLADLKDLRPTGALLGQARGDVDHALSVYGDTPANGGARAGDTLHGAPITGDAYDRGYTAVEGGFSFETRLVGHVEGLDPNPYDVVNVRLAPVSQGSFTLDDKGNLYVGPHTYLDYSAWLNATSDLPDLDAPGAAATVEARLGSSYVAHLTVTDIDGKSTDALVAIHMGPQTDHPPVPVSIYDGWLPPQAPGGSLVGYLSSYDPDGNPVTFSVPDSSPFRVGDYGTLYTKDGATYSFDSNGELHVAVTASDGTSLTTTDVVIKQDHPVTGVDTTLPASISSLTRIGTVLGTVLPPNDGDGGQYHYTYAFGDYVQQVGNDIVLSRLLGPDVTSLTVHVGGGDRFSGYQDDKTVAVTQVHVTSGDPSRFTFNADPALAQGAMTVDEHVAFWAPGYTGMPRDVLIGTVALPEGFAGDIAAYTDDFTSSNSFEIRNRNQVWLKGGSDLDRETLGDSGVLPLHVVAIEDDENGAVRTELNLPTVHVHGLDEGFYGVYADQQYVPFFAPAHIVANDPDTYDDHYTFTIAGGDDVFTLDSQGNLGLKPDAHIEWRPYTLVVHTSGPNHTGDDTFNFQGIGPRIPFDASFDPTQRIDYSADPKKGIELASLKVAYTPGDYVQVTLANGASDSMHVVDQGDGNYSVVLNDDAVLSQLVVYSGIGIYADVTVEDLSTRESRYYQVMTKVTPPPQIGYIGVTGDLLSFGGSISFNIHYNNPNGYELGKLVIPGGDKVHLRLDQVSITGSMTDDIDVRKDSDGDFGIFLKPGVHHDLGTFTTVGYTLLVASDGWSTSAIGLEGQFAMYSPPSGISFSTNPAIYEMQAGKYNYSQYITQASGNYDGGALYEPDRDSHIHYSTDSPDIFRVGETSFMSADVTLKPGVDLLPGRIYTTNISTWDDTFPDSNHVGAPITISIPSPSIVEYGFSHNSNNIATFSSNDPFDGRIVGGYSEGYAFQVVGGRSDILGFDDNRHLMAPYGLNPDTDDGALVRVRMSSLNPTFDFATEQDFRLHMYGSYNELLPA